MSELPATMHGIHLIGHGGPEMLVHRHDLPLPVPAKGEVLIKVGAAAVNNTDINTRIGWYSKSGDAAEDAAWTGAPLELPRIQGIDACGTIVSVGSGVDAGRIGERVLVEPCIWQAGGERLDAPWFFGSECDGAFAEFTKVASVHAHRIECGLSDAELASFPCSYSTAENLLTKAALKAGERVLITGASGGVGSAAVQLAKARAAEVIAVTSPAKSAALQELGADRTLGRNADLLRDPGRDSVDVIVDLVGGPNWPNLLEVLTPGGRYTASGAIAGPLVELDLRTLYLKDLSLLGGTRLEPGVFANLIGLIETGKISPLVSATYPLARIAEAQAEFELKKHVGKIVLTL